MIAVKTPPFGVLSQLWWRTRIPLSAPSKYGVRRAEVSQAYIPRVSEALFCVQLGRSPVYLGGQCRENIAAALDPAWLCISSSASLCMLLLIHCSYKKGTNGSSDVQKCPFGNPFWNPRTPRDCWFSASTFFQRQRRKRLLFTRHQRHGYTTFCGSTAWQNCIL